MADVSFTRAAGAYSDALRVANSILDRSSSTPTPTTAKPAGASFLELVGNALQGAASTGYKSETVTTQAISGKADLTDVVTAVSEAETALNAVVAVRDRVINAYQEIIKMPV
jgi:flagellar hook-basal body complex protein FliE